MWSKRGRIQPVYPGHGVHLPPKPHGPGVPKLHGLAYAVFAMQRKRRDKMFAVEDVKSLFSHCMQLFLWYPFVGSQGYPQRQNADMQRLHGVALRGWGGWRFVF
jgi:hypothetical protein